MRWVLAVVALAMCLTVCLLVVAIRARAAALRKVTCEVQDKSDWTQAELGFYRQRRAALLRRATLSKEYESILKRAEY